MIEAWRKLGSHRMSIVSATLPRTSWQKTPAPTVKKGEAFASFDVRKDLKNVHKQANRTQVIIQPHG
jgi:hypothetical protein